MPEKEFGSDFSLPVTLGTTAAPAAFFHHPSLQYYVSGRAALYALLQHAGRREGWTTLWIPDYYCHEVVAFVAELPLSILYYKDSPLEPVVNIPSAEGRSAAVVVNYFGHRRPVKAPPGCDVLEDFTHAPLALPDSVAPYAFASLRKSFPLPVGGAVFVAPDRSPLPPPSEMEFCSVLAKDRKRAMELKGSYLEGAAIAKEEFRRLFAGTEARFSAPDTTGSCPAVVLNEASFLDLGQLEAIKARNLAVLCSKMEKKELCLNFFNKRLTFGLILVLRDETTRNMIKSYLVDHLVYPAVLWPEQFTAAARDFEGRMLFVHTDFRYSVADMELLAEKINTALRLYA